MLLPMLLLLLYSTLAYSPFTICYFQFPVAFHSTPKQKSCALLGNFCSLITIQCTATFPQLCSLCIIIDPSHGCVWGLFVLNSLHNPRRSYVSFLQKKGICSLVDNPSPISIFTSPLHICSFIFKFTFSLLFILSTDLFQYMLSLPICSSSERRSTNSVVSLRC